MLNTEHFLLLAGEPEAWDAETRALPDRGESLCRLQERQHARGRRSAELVESIHGWYVRAGSGLDSPSILASTRARGGPLDGSLKTAVAWGRGWVNGDPANREFYVRKGVLAGVRQDAIEAAWITGFDGGLRPEIGEGR